MNIIKGLIISIVLLFATSIYANGRMTYTPPPTPQPTQPTFSGSSTKLQPTQITLDTSQGSFILSTGVTDHVYRCGWARRGSTNYNNYDSDCNNGYVVSNQVCPSGYSPQVTVSLVRYGVCDYKNMYGISMDQPTISEVNGKYRIYWKSPKKLFAGYNDCDDQGVSVSYVVTCVDNN